MDLYLVPHDKAAPAASQHLSNVDPGVVGALFWNTGLVRCCEKIKEKNPARTVKRQDQIIKFI